MKSHQLKPENIELSNKILDGIWLANKELMINSALKNEKLVIADKDGNVLLVPAKRLLKGFLEKERARKAIS